MNFLSLLSQSESGVNMIRERCIQVIQINGYINQSLFDKFLTHYKKCHPKNSLILELTTVGGELTYAYMLCQVILNHEGHVECRIPNYALSAGTLIAIACDSIKISPYTQLSGISPQYKGYDLSNYQKLLTELNMTNFKETFTEVITKLSTMLSTNCVETSNLLINKLFKKKFGENEIVKKYFMKTITHDTMIEFDEIPEEIRLELKMKLKNFHTGILDEDTEDSD